MVGPCGKCGKNHDTKDCCRVNGACFRCGKMGHLVKDCPMQAQQQQEKPKVHRRVFAITQQDAQASQLVIQGNLRISKMMVRILIVVKINCLHKIKEERKRSNTQIKNTRIYVVRQYAYIHRRRQGESFTKKIRRLQ
jgi:hypothetical protein